jgi:uracil-DNA glycosylase family protein
MTEERPGAERWVPDGATLPQLREAAQGCRGCELYRDATQAVMGDGLKKARLVLLGEQPGDQEDRQGKPFVGPAGRVLADVLDAAGIDRSDTYRTNVVKHFRWRARGKRRIHETPNQVHVTACAPWLVAEFAQLRPAGVVVLGGTAGKLVFGSSFRVGEMRGKLVDWPERFPLENPPDWVLPTTHPSAILRAEDAREAAYEGLVADLKVAAEALAVSRERTT